MLIGVSVYGEDKPGIIYAISKALADKGANIVDIEQNVIQGMFVMFLVAEAENAEEVVQEVKKVAEDINVNVLIRPFEKKKEEKKELYVVTILGRDRVGIVRDITRIFLEFGINVVKTSLTARGELISIEFTISAEEDIEAVKNRLRKEAEKLGLDIVLQPYEIYRKEKRLVVFDMDSTLVDAEIIDELAKEAGVYEEVKRLTEKAMKGEMDFKSALVERVKLLKGLPAEVLEKIYSNIKLTNGAKELIMNLKQAGYKVAVVSGGFSYFTDRLKEELGLDYAFGNELEIKDGKITGRIKGRVIDAEEKAKIIDEIAKIENIKPENIVAVG
ncbi:MAG: phosphoserine phosphatase SerB, partial [Archaeoglobaceae archaeon]